MPGIRGADASFRSGALRVTYDDAVTSPDDVEHIVRELGISTERNGRDEAAAGWLDAPPLVA